MYDHSTQRPRGFGFITYDSEEAVDRVLVKTCHELNGKMVEVKRAVPKELSPGSIRSPIPGYNCGINRMNNFLNGYPQGYNPSMLGRYGARMDGRFSAIDSGRSGFSPFGSGFAMCMVQPGLNANYGSNLNYREGLNPCYIGTSNRCGNLIGYGGGNGGSTSLLSSNRNLCGNGALNYGTNTSSSASFMVSGTGNLGGTFGSSNVNWGLSPISSQSGGNATGTGGNLGYVGAESSYNLGAAGHARNSGSNAAPTSSSYTSSNGGYDGTFADLYGGSPFYGDPTWRAAMPEQDGSSSFAYGLRNTASDVPAKGSAGYVGGFSFNKRQPNRGIPS